MPLLDIEKGSFSSGELSPRMFARQDVDRYKNGAALLEGFRVLPQGGIIRCEGTRYVATAKYANRLCLVKPFEPSVHDAYALEVGHEYMRFFKNNVRIESPPGTPVELATPYQEAHLRGLRTAQSNDVMIITHLGGLYAPLRLSRLSDTSWDLRLIRFDPPPTYEAGFAGTPQIALSAMTGTGVTVTSVGAFWLLADVDRTIQAGSDTVSGIGRGVIRSITDSTHAVMDILEDFTSVNFAAGTWTLGGSPVANVKPSKAGPIGAAVSLTLQAAVGQNLVTDGEFDTAGPWTDLSVGPGVATIAGGRAGLHGHVGGDAHIEQHVTGLTPGMLYQVTFEILSDPIAVLVGTASGTDDIVPAAWYNPGVGLQLTFAPPGTGVYLGFRNQEDHQAYVDHVNLHPLLLEGWRQAEIDQRPYVLLNKGIVQLTGLESTTVVHGVIIRSLDTNDEVPAAAWTMEQPAWSTTLGWPYEVILYEGRLCFFGSPRFPQDIWQSAVDDFFNMALGPLATDAIHISIVDSGGNITLNALRWAMPAENLLIGTSHGEYRLIGPGDDPLTPVSLPRNRIQSTFGSDDVKPLKVGSAILFVQRQGSKVREMAFDERTQTTFVARDITVTSDHLLRQHRLLELSYQQEPLSTVWGVRSDGQLLGLTYDQSEQMVAWWRRLTQGIFESSATIPHPSANAHQVWLAVQRTIGGLPVRFIERLDPEAVMTLPTPVSMVNELTQDTDVIDHWTGLTVDAGVVYQGAATATITGLGHLEGATVKVVGDGAVFPDAVVTGGQVTLPQAVQCAFVGLEYIPRGKTMPVDAPVRGPTQQGRRKRWVSLRARVEGTACLVLKPTPQSQPERIPFRQPHMPQNQGVAPFSGDREVTPLGWDRMGMIEFYVDQPLPATILGIMGVLDAEAER